MNEEKYGSRWTLLWVRSGALSLRAWRRSMEGGSVPVGISPASL